MRSYLEIRPTETSLAPATVSRAMDVLQTSLSEATQTGLRHVLAGSVTRPVVEWLLVGDGRSDTAIRYLVGSTDPDHLSDVQRVLRTALPNTYEIREVDWHPRHIHEFLPVPSLEDPADGHQATTDAQPYVAGVEYRGHATRRRDWQAPLRSFTELLRDEESSSRYGESRRVPLATLIEAMREADVPVIYQAVCRPHADWSDQHVHYVDDLRTGTVSVGDKLLEAASPRSAEERRSYEPPQRDQQRIEVISSRDPGRTLCVSARAVALTRTAPRDADDVARKLASAFGHVGTQFHEVTGHVRTDRQSHALASSSQGTELFEDIVERTVHSPTYERLRNRLPWRETSSKGVVVDPATLPNFCLVGGGGLTPDGTRALGTRPAEQTGIPLPEPAVLSRYTGEGMPLCMPLTHDREPYGHPLILPPKTQDLHLFVGGVTGAGKSVLVANGMLANTRATAGADILLDWKGGSTAREYLMAHYAEYGHLDNVLYFDCSQVLPALSFFDIEPLLAVDVPRTEAVSRKTGQYLEILEAFLGSESFTDAKYAVEAIRNHVGALFDPVHGADQFGHDDLHAALDRTVSDKAPPAVTDDKLDGYFTSMLDRDKDMFNKIVGGALNRVEKIHTNGRLAPVFNHVPDGDDDPQFDFLDVLNDDVVVIFDFGGMEQAIKKTLTLLLLANLWTALKIRNEGTAPDADVPLVNLYLEEAADVADTEIVGTLLSKGRSFGLSALLGVQFPQQLDSTDPAVDIYLEALNDISTIVMGNVSVPDEIATALATGAMDPAAVNRRLSALQRGDWFVQPASPYGESLPRPFMGRSLSPPAGHPAGDDPLTEARKRGFEKAVGDLHDRATETAGLPHSEPDVPKEADEDEREALDPERCRVDSLLPYTQRLPAGLNYREGSHALVCEGCNNRYDPTLDGLRNAIECCHSLADVDRDNVPICTVNLKLSPEEIEASEWSVRQLLFLQTVYNVQQQRHDQFAYDIVDDSMTHLRAYVGIDNEEVRELVDAGILRDHGNRPHKLYSVVPDGREVIGERYRKGIEFGHGQGDLEESAEHVLLIEILARFMVSEFQENPESAVENVIRYYELQDGEAPAEAFMGDDDDVDSKVEEVERRRLDVAGVDADGNIVVVGEAERLNNDSHEAIPADYDKMAACDPEEAIWVTLNRADAHDVLNTLNDPADGEPRVEKSYAEGTPTPDINLDADGATAIYAVNYLRRVLEDDV